MGKKIKNLNYRKFLDEGIIEYVTEDHIKEAFKNIDKNVVESECLIIALYYTGARPNEVLSLRGKDITKQKGYVLVKLPGSKGGLPRTIYLRYKLPLVKKLYQYSNKVFGDMFLFYHFRNKYKREHITKQGKLIIRYDTTGKIRYYINKWFEGVIPGSITPYYLRHNRFSQLSEAGSTPEELRHTKGSKSLESVMSYLHMSSDVAKKVARRNK